MCAGIPRSGSTWLYNAARLLFSQPPRTADAVYGAWIEQYDSSNPARVHVVKVHEPSEPLIWRAKSVLTSRRDLRDIAASAWKRGWVTDEDSTLAFLDSVVRQHAFWKPRCAFEMIYERMRAAPVAELGLLAAALGMQPSAQSLNEVAATIDALGHDTESEDAFNAANLLHKQHVMDGRIGYHAETLPAALVTAINQRYADWLAAHGHL